jgi:hypothetical protein
VNGFLIAGFLGLSLCGSLAGAELIGDVEVRLRVIDGVTKVPVSRAEIGLRKGESEVEKLGVATNGVFSFVRSAPPGRIQLRVRAEDYGVRGLSVELTNARIQAVLEMDRTVPFRGIIATPKGEVAIGAKIVLIKNGMFVGVDADGNFSGSPGMSVVITGPDGSFSIAQDEQAEALLIVHESGISQIPLVGWTNDRTVRLLPWVGARGRMLINDAPAANERVVANRVMLGGTPRGVYLNKFETQTDAIGNFFFNKLPPGEVTLFWKVPVTGQGWTFSHGTPFGVGPGNESAVVYHLRGRTVRGQIVVDEKFDWNADHIFGHLESKAQPVTEFSPMGVAQAGIGVAVKVDKNGRFEAVATAPGSYILNVRLYKGDATQAIRREVIVPDGEGLLDVGELRWKMSAD